MTVYVDNAFIPYRRGMLMSHMLADTEQELRDMAKKIGVNLKYEQYPGTPRFHFDICKNKRQEAIRFGAVPIDCRDLVRALRGRTNPNQKLEIEI